MKRIVLLFVFLAAAIGVELQANPGESKQIAALVMKAALSVWDSIEANPVPVAVALGTFLLTVIFYKVKGKSLRESVEVAATRVMVVSVPPTAGTGEAASCPRPFGARNRMPATRSRRSPTRSGPSRIGGRPRPRRLPTSKESGRRRP